jgi:hypothetical protein
MKRSFADLIVTPNVFFQQLMVEKENIRMPGLIVLAAGIIAAAYAYLIGGLTAKLMAGIMPGMETIITLTSGIGAFIATFIIWILASGLFYAFSFAFGGKGQFNRMLEAVGYGYLPQVFGTIINLIVASVFLPRVIIPNLAAASAQDPQVMLDATKALMHDPAMMSLTQITSFVSIVFLLWSANIWIFGVKYSRGLSLRDAAICVLIPAVGYSLYSMYVLTVI